jgi:hypothetical protein
VRNAGGNRGGGIANGQSSGLDDTSRSRDRGTADGIYHDALGGGGTADNLHQVADEVAKDFPRLIEIGGRVAVGVLNKRDGG